MKHNKGIASTVMLLALFVVGLLCVAASDLSISGMKRVKSDRDEQICVQAAQAGLEHTVSRAFTDLPANGGVFKSKTYTDLADVLGPIATGVTATSNIQPQANNAYAYVTCTANYGGFTKSFRTLIKEKDVGIWNNAVFAGVGASGQAINGNVQIRGSVHILGDGEPYTDAAGIGTYFAGDPFTDSNHNGVWDPGEPYTDSLHVGHYVGPDPYNDVNGNGVYDPPLTQTSLDDSMSGAAYIGNNYYGIPSNLATMIPVAPQVGGVETLSTEVRSKHGQISISGTASIGTSSVVNGGLAKATVDGMYVNDGYTGNKGSASVFSDNGTTNTYDLGNLGITMPIIYGIGAQAYTDPNGVVWPSLDNYYQNNGMLCVIPTITSTTTAFSFGPDNKGNSISFTPKNGSNPAVLTVNGVIRLAADLQLGSKDTITYKGNGTIYDQGTINIDGDVVPASGQTFPTSARVGFVARKDMNLACGNGSSQLTMAGAFYAQGTIKSAKQNNIAGTFVASYFDMGTNVPAIFQCPTLPYNMPPAMPGDKHFFSLKVNGWRERATGG